MKHEHTQTGKNRIVSAVVTAFFALVLAVCCFAVPVFADETVALCAGLGDITLGLVANPVDSVYEKPYDGTTDVTVSLSGSSVTSLGVDPADAENVTVNVSAVFNSKNVADASYVTVHFELSGSAASKYRAPDDLSVSARIVPRTLEWSGDLTVHNRYRTDGIEYATGALKLANLIAPTAEDIAAGHPTLNGVIPADLSLIAGASDVTARVQASAVGTYTAKASFVFANATMNENYRIPALNIIMVVDPVEIVKINWASDYTFVWGDAEADRIALIGEDANWNRYPLFVSYPEGYGNVGTHTVEATLPDAVNFRFKGVESSKNVVITKAIYIVSMKDATYVPNEAGNTEYLLPVSGEMPEEIRSKITYTVDGAAFTGAVTPGVYRMIANLPVAEYGSVCEFRNDKNQPVTQLSAVLTLKKTVLTGGTADAPYSVIAENPNGFGLIAGMTVTDPGNPDRKAISSFRFHTQYRVVTNGTEGATYSLIIPISDVLYHKSCDALTASDVYLYDKATETMKKAADNAAWRITVGEGSVRIDGIQGDADLTFVLAPAYHLSFWLTAPGIALIILAVLLLLLLLGLIGLYLRRAREGENEEIIITTGDVTEVEANPVPDVADDEEYLANTAETVAENMDVGAEEETVVADEDAVKAAVAEAMAENLNESADLTGAIVLTEDELDADQFRMIVDAIVDGTMKRTVRIDETEETIAEVPAEEVAEIEETVAEVEETVAEVEETAAEEVAEVVDETAEETVEETADDAAEVTVIVADSVVAAFDRIAETGKTPEAVEGTTAETISVAVEEASVEVIPEDWSEEMATAVKGAVADEFASRLLAEPAVEAFATVDADDDDDNDDEEVEEGFGGPAAGLKFFDAKAYPEVYAALLDQEARGEVRITTRFRRSYESRVAQAQGNIAEYYSAIKNELLSFKGIKARTSWGFESFNRGRIHVAKLNVKSRTMYLYLALDPAELADGKYGIKDVSDKKKYASVPVLMKIKGDRKFKYALELIRMLGGEKLGLKKLDNETVDYTVPFSTTEEMVEDGRVKMMVAGIPLSPEVTAVTPALFAEQTEEPVGAVEGEVASEANVAEAVEVTAEAVADTTVTEE